MLVGEAPGANEDREGEPFVGDAGRVLDALCASAGLSRDDIYITNVVKCRPPGNRNPTPAEVEACRLYFVRELEAVDPTIIVALGTQPGKALTGRDKIAGNRGRILPLKPEYRSDVPVVITYHPAASLHNPREAASMKKAIVEDLTMAQSIAAGADKPFIATRDDDVREVLRALRRAPLLGCDLEFEVLPEGGRNPWSRRGDRVPTWWALGLAGRVDGKLIACSIRDTSQFLPAVRWLLNRIPSTYHNANADVVWLLDEDIKPIIGGDTLLAASLLNLDTALTLEALVVMLAGLPPWKAAGSRGDWSTRPRTEEEWERELEYNGRDALASVVLDETLNAKMEQELPQVVPLYRLLLKATATLTRVSMTGAPVDEEGLDALEGEVRGRLRELRTLVADVLDVPGYATKRSGSVEAVALSLERLLGIQFPKTPTKKPSMTIDTLSPYKGEHESVDALLSIAELTKLHGTYLKPWRFLVKQQRDARLHTIYKLWAARTGRSSAEHDVGGTIQQVPRPKRVRSLIKAREGRKIVSADQSQIELRIAAWVAREENMVRFINEGIDPHKATAAWVKVANRMSLPQFLNRLDELLPEVTYEERFSAKAVNFGFLFGMREKKFIATARKDYGVTFTPQQAGAVRRGYFTLYPRFEEWHEESWKWVELGYVDTVLGRRRPLIVSDNEDAEGLLRKAVNTPVQGTASDISLLSLPYIEERIEAEDWDDDSVIIAFVHDANMFEIVDDLVVPTARIIKAEMEQPQALQVLGVHCPVPLAVEITQGQSWGDGEVIELD